MGGKSGKGNKGGKGKKGGGCPPGEVAILIPQSLYDVVQPAINNSTTVGPNQLVCLNSTTAMLLFQVLGLALGVGDSKKKKKGKKGKGKKGGK